MLEDPLPVNLGLRVKPPSTGSAISGLGIDGLCDFDALDINGVRRSSYSLETVLTCARLLDRNEPRSPN